MKPLLSTSDFVDRLREHREIQIIDEEIDPDQELAELQRRTVERRGPALLFTKVKGTRFPVATNLYGSQKRIGLAFGKEPEVWVRDLVHLMDQIMPPTPSKIWGARKLIGRGLKIGKTKWRKAPVLEERLKSLFELPQIKSWPEDGGAFVTLPLVYTESPSTGKSNLGMYRIQIHGEKQTGMHIQIHRGGGFHYYEAEQARRSLPAEILVGGPPAMTIAAVAPLPEDIPEILLASLLMGRKLPMTRKESLFELPFVSTSDFWIAGEIPPQVRKPEGPFGDHYGYYALQHDYPVLNVKHIYARKNAIWPATVVGRPPQEDHWIAEYLQDLLSPTFSMVMPQVRSFWAYEESGVHSLASVSVKERYFREAFQGALRVLGEGQISLTKFLLVTDESIDLKDFRKTFLKILEKTNLETDFFVFSEISQDTLDYTGPSVNRGSKAMLLGVGDTRKNVLQESVRRGPASPKFRDFSVYCPGVLVVKGPGYTRSDGIAEELLADSKFLEGFLFVFIVDDVRETIRSDHDFIWNTFTRFEPGGDIYSLKTIRRNRVSFTPPLVVDCRMKDWYPKPVEVDPRIRARVEERFGRLLDSFGKDLPV